MEDWNNSKVITKDSLFKAALVLRSSNLLQGCEALPPGSQVVPQKLFFAFVFICLRILWIPRKSLFYILNTLYEVFLKALGLQIGSFLHYLADSGCSFLSHPYISSSFFFKDETMLTLPLKFTCRLRTKTLSTAFT